MFKPYESSENADLQQDNSDEPTENDDDDDKATRDFMWLGLSGSLNRVRCNHGCTLDYGHSQCHIGLGLSFIF